MNIKTLLPCSATFLPPTMLIVLLFMAAASPASAQRARVGTLTEAEIELVREAAVYPVERVNLYTKFLSERAAKIKDLANHPKSSQRVIRLEDALEDFTALMDEVGSNLDQYSDRHSDIRKALKPLSEAMPKWLTILRAVPGESGFDLSRKEAIEAGEELSGEAERLLKEQETYFATHKDEKDQERNERCGEACYSAEASLARWERIRQLGEELHQAGRLEIRDENLPRIALRLAEGFGGQIAAARS